MTLYIIPTGKFMYHVSYTRE